MMRDPRLPRRLVDAVPPERRLEAELAVIGKEIDAAARKTTQTITDVIAEVVDQAASYNAAQRAARRARLAAGALKPPPGR